MKDAGGHGSNSRGGSYPNIERSAFRKGQHVGYGGGTFRIQNLGGGVYRATEQKTGEVFGGTSLGQISQKLTDRAAAAELARDNPKAATPAPVHDGMSQPRSQSFAEISSALGAGYEGPMKGRWPKDVMRRTK